MEGLAGYGSNEEDSDKDSELQPMPQAPTSSSHPVYPVNVGAISNSRHFPAPVPNESAVNGSGAVVMGSISTALTVAGSTGAGVDPQMTNRRVHEMYALMEGPAHPYKKAGIDSVTGMGALQSTAIDAYTFNQEFQANESRRGAKSKLRDSGRGDDEGNTQAKKKKKVDPKEILKTLDDVGDEYSDPWAQSANADEEVEKRKADLEAVAARKKAMEDKKEQEEGEKEVAREADQKKLREQGIYIKDDENVNAVWLEKKLSGGTAPPAAGARGGGSRPDGSRFYISRARSCGLSG